MPELINREATLKKMCETCGYCERFENAMRATHPDFVTDKCNNYKFLEEQPAIEAEPLRHAHWVFRDEDKHLLEDGCIPYNMWCSYCNQWSDNDSYGDAYCRNCGARMDEPDLADKIAKEVSEDGCRR